MYQVHCRHFGGYKPCSRNNECNSSCPHLDVPKHAVLIVHLGAMGAVLRSTALLIMIKRKYPSSIITWVTEDHSKPILFNNPLIDRVLGINARDQLTLSALHFDVGYFIDKSPEVEGLKKLTVVREAFGFGTNPRSGAIVPLNDAASSLWELGLNNHKKFFENNRSELELMAEALELPYDRDPYLLCLTEQEKNLARERYREWSREGQSLVIGLNTGTSGILPEKTIPIEVWRAFLDSMRGRGEFQFVLLGGASDSERNWKIAKGFDVICSPTTEGLRDGFCSVEAVDTVITGDSLGMHIAIALKKAVIAWFGPTCAHEIDLYDRGIKLMSSLSCSPCWKRNCSRTPTCSQLIDPFQFETALQCLFKNGQLKKAGVIGLKAEHDIVSP